MCSRPEKHQERQVSILEVTEYKSEYINLENNTEWKFVRFLTSL